jgi:hypothetical protein
LGRRHLAGIALLTASAIVLPVATAGRTAGPSPGAVRAKLADAIEDERRAVALLLKRPPRDRTAELALEQAAGRLQEIRADLGRGNDLGDMLFFAIVDDAEANIALPANDPAKRAAAVDHIRSALETKRYVHATLGRPAASGAAQCADRRDNDGDRLVDAAWDPGCSGSADRTERTPLTCTLKLVAPADLRGSCSGPFGRLRIVAPPGTVFGAGQPRPYVSFAIGCRYSSPRQVDCLTQNGAANPTHAIGTRLQYRTSPPSTLRVDLRDFAGRLSISRTLTLPASPPPARPFTLGPSPVTAVGTFTNGRGGCPVQTSFTDTFQLLAPGDGTLTITQPSTGDRLSGPISPDGSFQLRSAGETYDGRFTGRTATATYTYTRNGCTETYDAAFALDR